ncbi:MAG: hypothetical protein IJT98_03540 [Prevotella sp.]|nr:hypothetical protein [Prevotella sp.]
METDNNKKWPGSVILADAEYADSVAFNLTVNFERMLERRIPPADLARWAECVALDGGVRGSDNDVLLVLLHKKQFLQLANFKPGKLADELDGKAFVSSLGEFSISAVSDEDMASKEVLLRELIQLYGHQGEVKHLMIVAPEALLGRMRKEVGDAQQTGCQTTAFCMEPVTGCPCRQEMLGYSLMAALGVTSEEIDNKLNKSQRL